MQHIDSTASPSCNGENCILILGHARIANVIEIAKLCAKTSACCIFLQIDGGFYSTQDPRLAALYFEINNNLELRQKLIIHLEPTNLGIAGNLERGMQRAGRSHVGIVILEDDCFPGPSFFDFTLRGLEVFRDQPSIGMITGNCFVSHTSAEAFSECSAFSQTWGWATWSDRWERFDAKLSRFSGVEIAAAIRSHAKWPPVRAHWKKRVIESIQDRNMWDAQWQVYCWINNYLVINPSQNLIRYSGVDAGATHTELRTIFTEWPGEDPDTGHDWSAALDNPVPWNRKRINIHVRLLRLAAIFSVLAQLGIGIPIEWQVRVAKRLARF